MLRWYLTNARSATIEPGIGALRQTTGEISIRPSETTTYTLTATSMDGTVATATATVQVAAAPVQAAPSVAINVYHDHGSAMTQGNLPSCWGQLGVVGNHLVYRVVGTNDGRRDDFDVLTTQVQEVGQNRMPIRGQQVFHVTVSGQHFNFIPANMAAVQAVNTLRGAVQGR